MKINTINSKMHQLVEGYFKIGNGSTWILIMGSCRTVPYVQYLADWNEANDGRFTVCFIDPFNFNYDIQNNRTDFEKVITSLEIDTRILYLLERCDIFIHEYYANFGMFNCDKKEKKNIYQFGMAAPIDICIPNWNDRMVLFGDIVSFDIEIRKRAISDYNVLGKLSDDTEDIIWRRSRGEFIKFFKICEMSSFPEFEEIFKRTYLRERMFWNSNHVSKGFTLRIFDLLNEKYLHLDLSKGFNRDHDDLFKEPHTNMTEYDTRMFYWPNEEVIPLKSKLF